MIPLHEAIALGRHLLRPESGGHCKGMQPIITGCALEMALVAVGSKLNWTEASNIWPWIGHGAIDPIEEIWMRFDDDVMQGRITMDEYIDWIRSIEPVEPTPVETTVKEEAYVVV
mgnify:CR=1 FL=1